MKLLCVGNTAQNGWLLATFLRQHAGLEVDLLHHGHLDRVYAPWWEAGGDEDWTCPAWARPFSALGAGDVTPPLCALAADYDLVLLIGGWVGLGPKLPATVPYLVLDCGLLRSLSSGTPDVAHALAGYRGAAHVVLTNADTEPAARALGLPSYSFLPHPVDTDRFAARPRSAPELAFRERVLDGDDGAELLCFSPTRHDEAAKATSVTVRAFAGYVAAAERDATLPAARLVLVNHGADAPAIAALCASLGIAERVAWIAPLAKWQLAQAYRAADVVLDQFSPGVGAFGTIAVETLACARPLITHLDPDAHAWCRDVLPVPPVCLAATVEDAAEALIVLARDPAERARVGTQGREWVDRWHSRERVAGLWAALCHRTLEREREERHALQVGGPAPLLIRQGTGSRQGVCRQDAQGQEAPGARHQAQSQRERQVAA